MLPTARILSLLLIMILLLLKQVRGLTSSSGFSLDYGSHLGATVSLLAETEKTLPDAPRFVRHPSPTSFVSTAQPAIIECVTEKATYMTIHCNEKMLEKKVEITHEPSRPDQQLFRLAIDYDLVTRWRGGQFYCQCEAWARIRELNNEYRKILSSRGYVKRAAFESNSFQFDPVPLNVSLDTNNVIMNCIPPKGHPKPKVTWLKDGHPLNVTGLNAGRFTVDHQASLIIQTLRLEDVGSYSCVAEILGVKIHSKPARLDIFVNGGWSQWTPWRGCDPRCPAYVAATGSGDASADVSEAAPASANCPTVCFSQRRSRQRYCNNPEPSAGGQPCRGERTQTVPCSDRCAVNGQWGQWSSWGVCNADCVSVRQRLCNSPPPSNGGLPCGRDGSNDELEFGDDSPTLLRNTEPWLVELAGGGKQQRNCTGGDLCKKDNAALLMYINENRNKGKSHSIVGLSNIAIYIGLFVAVAVIVTVLIVIVLLVRRKSVRLGGSSGRRRIRYNVHMNGNNSSTASSSDKEAIKLTHELLLPPETPNYSNNNGTTIKNPNVMDMSYKQLQQKQQQQQQQQQQQPATMLQSEQALRVHLPISPAYMQHQGALNPHSTAMLYRPPSSGVYSNSQLDEKCPGDEDDGGSRPCSALYNELSLGSHVTASFVPPGLCQDQLAWGSIGLGGGRLCLPEAGISLTIPAGAATHCSELFLSVSCDSRHQPQLTDRQTLLSPIVVCGSAASASDCPAAGRHAILSLPHSAALRQGFWNVSVLHSANCRGDAGGETVWQEYIRVGSESLAVSGYCQLDAVSSHLMVDRLGRFCLVGESLEGGCAAKRLSLVAFVSSASASAGCGAAAMGDFCLRLHVVPDTPDAVQAVLNQHQHQQHPGQFAGGSGSGGSSSSSASTWRLIESPKQLTLRDSGEPLCFCIEELSLGWRSKSKRQEVPFCHLWNGRQRELHCTFSLEHVDPTRRSLQCRIAAYQQGGYNARQTVTVSAGETGAEDAAEQPISQHCSIECNPFANSMFLPTSSSSMDSRSGCVQIDPTNTVFRLPPKLRKALCHLLDAPNARGNDWRALTRLLGVDRYIGYFASKPSPTDCVLDLWEARNREDTAVRDLADMLRAMNRPEVASLLEQQ